MSCNVWPTTLVNISDFIWLNDILRLIKGLQAEMGIEIPREQVSLSEVCLTVKSATELERCPVVPITNPQKSLQDDKERESVNLENEYVEMEFQTAPRLST